MAADSDSREPVGPAADERVRAELAIALKERLARDGRVVVLGHLGLLAILGLLIADDPVGIRGQSWILAVAAATALRAVLLKRITTRPLPGPELVKQIRRIILLQGIAWGGGAALAFPGLPTDHVSIILMSFSGLAGAAMSVMAADPGSYRLFLGAIYVPPIISLLILGTSQTHLVTAMLALFTAGAGLSLHQRAYQALVEHIRTVLQLSTSREEEKRHRAHLAGLLESAPIAIAVLDESKCVRSINPAFATLFGFAPDSIRGQSLDALLIPDTEMKEHRELAQRVIEGDHLRREVLRLDSRGALVPVRISAAKIAPDAGGGWVLLYEDIAEERLARDAIRAAHETLHTLVESAPVMIATLDRAARVQSWNPAAERIFGWTAAEVVGQTLPTIPMGLANDSSSLHQSVLAGATVNGLDVPALHKDGTTIEVSVSAAPMHGAAGTIDSVILVILDVSERKRAERALQDSETRFRRVAEANVLGICFWNVDGSIPEANDEFLRIIGFTRGELLAGQVNWRSATPPESAAKHDEALRGTMAGQTSSPFETEILRKDGSRIPILIGLAPLNGPTHFGVAMALDITERKAAERAMSEARALAERTAEARAMFLANMSHEIRTPMNGVLGMTEVLLDTELDTEQRRCLEIVHSSAEALLGVINDVLDYSKIEAEHLDIEAIPFDLLRMLHSTASSFATQARAKSLELVLDVSPETPAEVRGDPSRLRQVLTNLISNAIKFTETGEVVLGISAAPSSEGEMAIRFEVRDTGIGLPPDKLEMIFEEFTQVDGSISRRYGGTGLGLTIAQRLVRLMGGRISVTSESGRGSKFAFTLTLPTEVVTNAATGRPVPLEGQSVLVVDDNATNREVLRRMLTPEGARVVEAQSADEAWTALENAGAAGEAFALAIVDVSMPVKDGFDFVERLRADPATVAMRVLMLTSAGQRGDGARCRELGVQAYLTKPLSRSELIETTIAVLAGNQSKGSAEVVTRHSLNEARRSLKILLAEDVLVNQQVATTLLRKRGHTVVVADNGREAVEAVACDAYDLVLMDIQMPEMDGLEATEAIRSLPGGRTIPIVALTAHAMTGEREHCLARGMNGYLSKPFRAHELYAVVERWNEVVRPASDPESTAPRERPAQPEPAVCLEDLRRDLRDAGVEDVLDEIIDTFIESAPGQVAALIESLESGSADQVAKAAHALKSPSAAIGARSFADRLGKIEEAGRSNSLSERRALVAIVRSDSERVLGELQVYRGRAAA